MLLRAVLTPVIVLAPLALTEGARVAADHWPDPTPARTERQQTTDRLVAEVRRLSEQFDCSRTGLPHGVTAKRALVLVDERIDVVPFNVGWQVHQEIRPGKLLSVCAR